MIIIIINITNTKMQPQNLFTSIINLDQHIISMLDIDSIVTVCKINKTLNSIVKKNILYQQLLAYMNNKNKLTIFIFLCANNYIELIMYLFRVNYDFRRVYAGMWIAKVNNCDKILSWRFQILPNDKHGQQLCEFNCGIYRKIIELTLDEFLNIYKYETSQDNTNSKILSLMRKFDDDVEKQYLSPNEEIIFKNMFYGMNSRSIILKL